MTGVEFGGNRSKAHRQVFDPTVSQGLGQFAGEVAAADQAGAGQADVEIAEDAANFQPARPGLQTVELAGGIAAADHGADRGTDDDVRHDAVRGQSLQHADVSKAARGAAAERQANARPRAFRFDLGRGVGGAVATRE